MIIKGTHMRIPKKIFNPSFYIYNRAEVKRKLKLDEEANANFRNGGFVLSKKEKRSIEYKTVILYRKFQANYGNFFGYLYRYKLERNARKTVQEQYRSVWESCTQNAGLKRPSDQRPVATNLSWQEAVRIQEQAASRIRDWFTLKTRQAFIERQKRIQEDEARKAAIAAAQAEEAKRRAEETARIERERGEALIEAMKRKHRGNS